MGQDLLALYAEYQAHLKDTSGQGAAAPAFKSSNAIAPVAGGSVVIDATASGDAEVLAADLRALGAENVTAFGRMVSGRLPITAIRALQDLSSLQFARPAYATTNVEDVGGYAAPRKATGFTPPAVFLGVAAAAFYRRAAIQRADSLPEKTYCTALGISRRGCTATLLRSRPTGYFTMSRTYGALN